MPLTPSMTLMLMWGLVPPTWMGTGFSRAELYDADRHRALTASVWYPSEVPDDQYFSSDTGSEGFRASENVPVRDGSEYPLFVLIAPGHSDMDLGWLAARLARHGAVVITTHENTESSSPLSSFQPWQQTLDASFLMDSLSSLPVSAHIDMNRAAVVGYAIGGFSALALGGAQFDLQSYQQVCDQSLAAGCRYYGPRVSELDEMSMFRMSLNYRDARFRSVIAIAPDFFESVSAESLAGIDVPTTIIGAELDQFFPIRQHIFPKQVHFSGQVSVRRIAGASRNTFLPLCRDPYDGENCRELGVKPRNVMHDEIYKIVRNLKYLPPDVDSPHLASAP